jgi:hypothetical protein
MHIGEISFCSEHLKIWVDGQKNHNRACGVCRYGIIEYIPVDVMFIKDHYIPL